MTATKHPEPAPATPAPAPRMTLSRVVEQLLARGGAEHSSVTLSRNAKGETQIELVVRTGERSEVETIEQAVELAEQLYDRLRERYPFAPAPVDVESKRR
jgi:hypothetical protein